jgi:hypothetical protein
MTRTTLISVSAILPTPAEAAAAAVPWERRGVLGRLVRLDGTVSPPEQTQPERPNRRGRTAEALPEAS